MSDILASRYNVLVNKINKILGRGTGTFGYGQPLVLTEVEKGNDILASHMSALYDEFIKARVHQIGPPPPTDIARIVNEDIVVEDDPVSGKGIVQFEQIINLIEAERLLVDDDSQITVEETDATVSRNTLWNNELSHSFRISFNSADHRRHFFNAGGKILINASLGSPNSQKDRNWESLLFNMGVISFSSIETSTTAPLPNATITTSVIGNYELTANMQTLFTKNASGSYSENRYIVKGKELNVSDLEFEILFEDNDTGNPNADESITGDLTSTIQIARPLSDEIEVDSPEVILINGLTGN